MRKFHVLVIAAPLVQFACGGSQPPADTPDPATSTGSGAVSAADAPPTGEEAEPAATSAKFDDMAPRERMNLMQSVVVPEMTTVFQSHDAEYFAEVTCVTCHGPGAGRGEFDMPSASLPKLPANGAFDQLKADKGAVVEFMRSQVVPKMASILGE